MNIKTALTVSVILNIVLIVIVYKDDKLLAIKEAVQQKQASLRKKNQLTDESSKLSHLNGYNINDYYDDDTSKTDEGEGESNEPTTNTGESNNENSNSNTDNGSDDDTGSESMIQHPDNNPESSDQDDGDDDSFSDAPITLADGKMYTVVGQRLRHEKAHFTQGLTYSPSLDTLYESVGQYRKSSVCKLDPLTGDTIKCQTMDDKYFGEGMQVYGRRGSEMLIQLTWKANVGFIYDARSLDVVREFTFHTKRDEGWGICIDRRNHEFIVSDGSEVLHFWDVDSLKEKRRVTVMRQSGEIATNINELEFVDGKVLANVWFEDVLLVIDPVTGKCEHEYDFSSLWPEDERKKKGGNVLNGISVSDEEGVIYMTGKYWDRMYKVSLRHQDKNQEQG